MDGAPENEENEVSADSFNKEDILPDTVYGNEKEGDPAEMVTSNDKDDEAEAEASAEEAPVEEAATTKPEENCGNELPGVNNITASQDLDVKINAVKEEPASHEESVVFEINSDDDADGPPRLQLETPESENTSPQKEEGEAEEEEEEEPTASPAEDEDTSYDERTQLLQELCAERDRASKRSSQLQMKLAEYFHKKARDDCQPEREIRVSEQLQEYERCLKTLSNLKQKITAGSEAAQQQAEELRLQAQEKLDKVDSEWQAFMALKRDVAVIALSQHLGKQAAQAKVEATLAEEQRCQDELTKLRLEHFKINIKIHRLESELCDREERKDPLQLQFERLQAERLEQKKHIEKRNEELLKTQKKMSHSLELLSNLKEKLFWSQEEVKAKREQVAELEATVATKRDLLTRTKQACRNLQKENLRLKESRGLLGNRLLLQDFEDTVDACDRLEERHAEAVFRCERLKEKLETKINNK